VAVNDIPDSNEVVDNGLEKEVVVNDIPETEEDVAENDDEEVTGIFMVLKQHIPVMLTEFV